MITIHQYPVATAIEHSQIMPSGAKILSVQLQNGAPVLWALVDTNTVPCVRLFSIRGIGYPMDGAERGAFVGTFQLGASALHLFDRGEKELPQ